MSSAVPGVARVTDEQFAQIARRLVATLAPREVYAFGSHVYGIPTADSDIDVLVAVDDAELAREDQDERGYRALRGLFLPIELHIVGLQQFKQRAVVPASLEHEVSTKGRLLYAA